MLSEEDSRTGTDEGTEHLRFGVPPPPRHPRHIPSIWFPDPTPPEPSSSWHLHAFVDEGRTHYFFYYVCVTTTFVCNFLICLLNLLFTPGIRQIISVLRLCDLVATSCCLDDPSFVPQPTDTLLQNSTTHAATPCRFCPSRWLCSSSTSYASEYLNFPSLALLS